MAPAAMASRITRGSSVAETITTGRAGNRRRSSSSPPRPSDARHLQVEQQKVEVRHGGGQAAGLVDRAGLETWDSVPSRCLTASTTASRNRG